MTANMPNVPDRFNLAGQIIIVTGAGRGLGRTFAIGLANVGAHVVVAGRSANDLQDVVAQIAVSGGTAMAHQFDASDADQCANLVAATVERFGALNGIVVNHGITVHATAYDVTPEDFRKVVDVNLSGAFLCSQAAGRQMRDQRRGGSVVLISSNASFLAYDELIAYGASKGGLDQICRQLGAEWAPDAIRVNAIGPGYMDSHMRGTEGGYEDDENKRRILSAIPMQRRGEPDELLGAAMFFLSEASTYVTGQYLAIDGGYSLV